MRPWRERLEAARTDKEMDELLRELQAWRTRGLPSTPYASLPFAEPLATFDGGYEEPELLDIAEELSPYEREVLRPWGDEREEWIDRAREHHRTLDRRQEDFSGHGSIVTFAFAKYSNARMRDGFAAVEEEESERRRREDESIRWCDEVTPECWPDERDVGWCDVGHDPFGDHDDWAWCNEDHHAWCLDSGGGWCEWDADGWCDDETVCWGLWDGGGWEWCDED